MNIRLALSIALLIPSIVLANLKIDHHVSPDGKTETWKITEPIVNQRQAPYNSVRFQPGDGITIQAGGCVQTGGSGRTWKRYVDPRADDAPTLYYGTIWIPGVLGDQPPNVLHVKDALGTRWGVPVDANPAQLSLILGYLDQRDAYGDNGYYSHDDGTDDQCKNSENAFVIVTATRRAGGKLWGNDKSAPFDLHSFGDDDNFIALNPDWAYDKQPGGSHPSAESLCAVVTKPANGTPVTLYFPDAPPCVSPTTFTERDEASAWRRTWTFQGSSCAHANWGLATYTGNLQFESHSDFWDMDDDYSWQLRTDGGRGLALGAPKGDSGARTALEPEFQAHETVDYFSSPWWSGFRDAVNRNPDDGDFHEAKDYLNAGNPNGRFAIVTGLMGLDLEHGIHTELHPVFAMAIRVKDDDPNDEHWAFFVRLYGDEGFCSSQEHYLEFLPDNKFTFRLPLIWGPNAEPSDDVAVDFREEHGTGAQPTVQFVKGQGIFVTFDMPENPAARQLIHGELHLKWNNANTARSRILTTAIGSTTNRVREMEANSGLEGYYARLIKTLTPAQRAELQRRVPKRAIVPSKVMLPKTARLVRTARTVRIARNGQRPKVRSVPDAAKAARDQQLIQALHNITHAPMPPIANGRLIAIPARKQ
jgi:hypothetical protein